MSEEESEPSKAGFKYVSLVGVLMTEVHAIHFKDDDDTCNELKQSIHDHALFFNRTRGITNQTRSFLKNLESIPTLALVRIVRYILRRA